MRMLIFLGGNASCEVMCVVRSQLDFSFVLENALDGNVQKY